MASTSGGDLFVMEGQTWPTHLSFFRPPYREASITLDMSGFSEWGAVNATHLFAIIQNSTGYHLAVYALPLKAGARPASMLALPNYPQSVALDERENVWIGVGVQRGRLVKIPAPYDGSNRTSIALGLKQPADIDVDLKGNAFVGDYASGRVYALPAPYSGPPKPVASGWRFAFDSSRNLYVSNLEHIDVYKPPYTSVSFSLSDPAMRCPGQLGFDQYQNLIVAQGCIAASSGAVKYGTLMFAPPYTGSAKIVAPLQENAHSFVFTPPT
jgi:hypothetical protein